MLLNSNSACVVTYCYGGCLHGGRAPGNDDVPGARRQFATQLTQEIHAGTILIVMYV